MQYTREAILEMASSLIGGDRAKQYLDAEDTHRAIGQMWKALLFHDDVDVPLSPATVALMMVCVKLVRAAKNPGYADSYVDIAGYAALAAEMAGSE